MGAGYETLAIARNLANNGEFANPFAPLPTGPTAHCAPLYPYFLALLLRLFGNTPAFVLAAYVCTMFVHALSIALLPRISELFFGDRRPGIYGAILSIPLPLFVLFPQYEIIHVAAGVMLFCLATERLAQRGGTWRGLIAGGSIGLLLLLNPASICIMAPWVGYLLWRRRIARSCRFVVFAGLTTIFVLTPWTLRNYRQFHKLFFIRDNLGLELYIANNDQALGSYYLNHQSSEGHARLHPNNSEEQAREVLRMGEIRYAADRMAVARDWIGHHPGRFLSLTATRVRMFWFPDADERPWNSRSVWLVTLASAAGILLLALRRKPIFVFLAAVLLVYPLMYYCVQADIRYRAPILWISLLGSGYLITSLTSRAAAFRAGARRASPDAENGGQPSANAA